MSTTPSTSKEERPRSTSSVTTRKSVENLYKIDLVGNTCHQITGSKLPSNGQVLKVMFYNMRFVRLTAKESVKLAINAVQIFWHQARLPIREEHKITEKLLRLYDKWKNIQKTGPIKRSSAQKKIADEFVESLDDLFDIATSDALETIKIAEDKQFLEMQRQKGRPGSMAGIDMILYGREKRAQERREKEEARKRKYEEELCRQAGNLKF